MMDDRCKQCDKPIPEWSFICPVCFCKETDKMELEECNGRD